VLSNLLTNHERINIPILISRSNFCLYWCRYRRDTYQIGLFLFSISR